MEQLQKKFLLSSVIVAVFLGLGCSSLIDTSNPALDLNRRVVRYVGVEVPIFVASDMPTVVSFPGEIISELWQGDVLAKQVRGSHLTLLAWPDFSAEGERVSVRLADGRPFRLWVLPAGYDQTPDKSVMITEGRSADDIFEERDRFGF